jgi:hypothetical protein
VDEGIALFAPLNSWAIAESFISSFQAVMGIAAGLEIISAIVAAFVIQPQNPNPSRAVVR